MRLTPLLIALPLAAPAAAQISLSLSGTLNIAPLNIEAVAAGAYNADLGRLWVADGGFNNTVYELDPLTGNLLFSFNANVLPGVTAGPDAMAIDPGNGNIFLWSAFRGGTGAGIVDQGGNLVAAFVDDYNIAAAAFTGSGELWTVPDGTSSLAQIDPATGAISQTIQLNGYAGRITALDWDPITDNLYLVTDPGNQLIAVDRVTGDVLGSTDLAPFIGSPNFPAGITFDGSGTTLYLSKGTGAGANLIYVFDRAGSVGSAYCSPAVPNSTGQPGTIQALGSDVAGGNPLQLVMSDLPTNQFGYFICGLNQGFLPLAGGSQGNLCLTVPFGRFASQLASSGAGGTIAIDVDTLALPLTPPVAAQAGEAWNFQGWYRDQNPGNTSNFTDAIEVTFQ